MKRVVAAGMFLALCSSAAFAGFDEGKKAFDAKDYATALKEWQPLAEQGDARAQGQLARVYFYGNDDIRKDDAKALEWARKAADKGDAAAENLIGVLYSNGLGGLKKDGKEAITWWLKAAEKGAERAEANLGFAYLNGEGVDRDRIQACEWFRKSAEHDFPLGMWGHAYCFKATYPQDFSMAALWYRKAAILGQPNAQKDLAELYDFSLTREKMQDTYGKGDIDALAAYDSIFKALPRDRVIALVLYRLAARSGAPEIKAEVARLEKQLNDRQIAEADAILKDWKPGKELPLTSKTGAAPRVVDAPPTGKPR